MSPFATASAQGKLPGPVPKRASVVLDTHVVLDWMVFRDPRVDLLAETIMTGGLRWLSTPAMRNELAQVVARGTLDRWQPDPARLFGMWDEFSTEMAPAEPTGPAARMRCRDPDDQKFIDLALSRAADWLLTRDRALLALAGRARTLGLAVITPEIWRARA